MDLIRLQHLEFYGRHGTELWEKQTGCRFTVDLELAFDFTRAGHSDKLEDTLDYRVIYSRARHVVEHESHNLIERVAWRLVNEMFRTFPIAHATVRVAKPEARIGGLNRAVEVEMSRSREQWERESAEEQEIAHPADKDEG